MNNSFWSLIDLFFMRVTCEITFIGNLNVWKQTFVIYQESYKGEKSKGKITCLNYLPFLGDKFRL